MSGVWSSPLTAARVWRPSRVLLAFTFMRRAPRHFEHAQTIPTHTANDDECIALVQRWSSALDERVTKDTMLITYRGHTSFKKRYKDQFWLCDCIMKETLWNRSEKVDHLACKYKPVHRYNLRMGRLRSFVKW